MVMNTLRCHQKRMAGKWNIEIGDFRIKTSIYRGVSIVMFDYIPKGRL